MNTNATLHAKVCAFVGRQVPIYVIGGNHRWVAYNLLHTKYTNKKDKIKSLKLDSILAAIYWWPDLSNKSITEMQALALRHNLKGECCVTMSFWDEVLLPTKPCCWYSF